MKFYDTTVLVTGGAGAIGSTLVAALLADAARVIVLDDLSSGYADLLPTDPRLVFIEGSITNDADVARAFSHPIQIVFHLAANFANQNSVDHPQKDLLVNGLGTLKILEASVRAKVERFVFASSSCVYGDMRFGGSEDSPVQLDTPYAMTKYLGEQYVQFYHEHHHLPTATVRIFNSYGPGERPGSYRNVLPNFLARAMRGEPLPITGTGEETRDFNYIDNTVHGLVLAATKPEAIGGVFNIGGGAETRIIDVANAVNEITSNTEGITFTPRRSWDTVTRRCADITRARTILGYEPRNDLREGIRKTHEWLKHVGPA